jgi:hypothetical protein
MQATPDTGLRPAPVRGQSQWNNPDYPFSLDPRNPNLEDTFFPRVEAGIKAEAEKLAVEIHPADLLWLEEFNGRYCHFLNPKSTAFKQVLRQDNNRGKSTASVVAYYRTKGIIVDTSPRFHSRSSNTQYNYEKICKQIWMFLSFIGTPEAYRSMLVLLLYPVGEGPYQTPSLDANYLSCYVQHRYYEFKEPILIEGTSQLCTFDGTPIMAEGAVKAVKWVGSFYAAVGHLHLNRHQLGPFRPACTACFNRYSVAVDKSLYRPHATSCPADAYQSTGNPSNSKVIKDIKDGCGNLNLERNYQARKRDILLPRDVLDIHKYIATRGYQLPDLMYYVILLISIDCALRYDGVQDKDFASWERMSHLWRIQTWGIEYLAHSVKEKNDNENYVYKQLFREVPEMDSLRFLLVFIHCSAHRTGPIFPHNVQTYTEDPQEDSPEMSVITENSPIRVTQEERRNGVSYKRIRKWICDRLKYNCKYTQNFKFGCHSPRVTFYFFTALSNLVYMLNLTFRVVKRNARHTDDTTSEYYQRDSSANAVAILSSPELIAQNPIYKFHDALLQDCGATAARINQMDSTHVNINTLPGAAEFFVQEMLGVPPSSPRYRDPEFLLTRSFNITMGTRRSASHPATRLKAYIEDEVPDRNKDSLLAMLSELMFHVSTTGSATDHTVPPPSATTQGAATMGPLQMDTRTHNTPIVVTQTEETDTQNQETGDPVVVLNQEVHIPAPVPIPPGHGHNHSHLDQRIVSIIPSITTIVVNRDTIIPEMQFQCLTRTEVDNNGPPQFHFRTQIRKLLINSTHSESVVLGADRLCREIASTVSSLGYEGGGYAQYKCAKARCRRDRAWIKRHLNRFFYCFTTCCGSEVRTFVYRNTHFMLKEFGGCATCHLVSEKELSI